MNSRLTAYLRRIGYGGPLSPAPQTLRGLHRAHLQAIPYEDLDVQLRRPLPLDIERTYNKIVVEERGGWCYEMNGLFAWALRELGFDVTMVAAGVGSNRPGSPSDMNHLVLIVRVNDRTYLADVGFGNAFLHPMPLVEGEHTDGGFLFRLQRVPDGWRFHNHLQARDTYDFDENPRSYEDFAARNEWLQTSADSPFVKNLVCHRFTEDGIITLRGAVLQTYTPSSMTERIAQSGRDLAEILWQNFHLKTEQIDVLWERVHDRHKDWLRKKLRGYSISL